MPPIGAAIAAVAAAGSIGGALFGAGTLAAMATNAAIAIGVSWGAGQISKALQKKEGGTSSSPGAPTGVQTSIQVGGSVPRSAIYGKQCTAGHLVYWQVYGDNNEYLQLVYAVGDGLHDGLDGLIVNGKTCTLGAADGIGHPVVEYDQPVGKLQTPHRMWVRFGNGLEGQAADAQLVAHANPADRWTAASRLAGIAYVSVTLLYDEKAYPSGLPSFQWIVRGLRCYDPRRDDTNGGYGPHRWNHPETYEWSDNPAIGLYNFQRGLYLGNELILGQGLAPVDLLTGHYVAAANACDEMMALATGGSEKRYRIGMQVSADRDHRSTIQQFLGAMAGTMIEAAGAFGPLAGVAYVPAASFTDDDIVAEYPLTFCAKRSRDELVNAVFATYSDPAQNWQSIPCAARTSSADELVDGDRLAVERDYPQIFSQTQCQRVAERERRAARRQKTATLTLRRRYIVCEPGDWLTWQSVQAARSGTYEVARTQVNPDQTITLSLRETAIDVYTWEATVDEIDPQHPADLPGYGQFAQTVAGLAVQDVVINGAGGLKVPALRATWSPTSDRTIKAAILQYRVQTQPATVKQIRCDAPDDGEQIIAEAINAATVYEVRATIETEPPRVTAWTPWIAETAPNEHVVAAAVLSNRVSSIDGSEFVAGLSGVGLVNGLPPVAGYTGQKIVFDIASGQIYTLVNGVWVLKVPAAGITGQIVADQLAAASVTAAKLADAAVTATKFAAGIEPISIVNTLPPAAGYVGPWIVYQLSDGRLYRYAAGQWTRSVLAVDVSGQLSDAQIAALSAAKLTGQIVATQITDGAVTTPKVAAGAIVTASLAANCVVADKIAADAVRTNHIAAGQVVAAHLAADSVTAGKIAAGAVGATQIAANAVRAEHILAGTITAGKLAIGRLENLIVNGDFTDGLNGWTQNNTGTASAHVRVGTGDGTTSAAYECVLQSNSGSGQSEIISAKVPSTPGEKLTLEFRVAYAGADYFAGLIFYSYANTYLGYFAAPVGQGVFKVSTTAPAWTAYVRAVFRCNQTTAYAVFSTCGLRRQVGTTLIEDGAITTLKLTANCVTANEIASGSITTDKLAVNAVTAGKIAVGAINASNILVNNLIVTGHMVAESATAIRMGIGDTTTVAKRTWTWVLSYGFSASVGNLFIQVIIPNNGAISTGSANYNAMFDNWVALYVNGSQVKALRYLSNVAWAYYNNPTGTPAVVCYSIVPTMIISTYYIVPAGWTTVQVMVYWGAGEGSIGDPSTISIQNHTVTVIESKR